MANHSDSVDGPEGGEVDLSLIEESLNYSYEERAVHHQRALTLALEFERAGRELRERSQQPTSAPLRR